MMNIFGNIGFNFALAYYANVRTIADHAKTEPAISVFNILRRFFKRKRTHQTGSEPTEMQLERDLRALLHGRKDGEIIIKNETPHTAGGIHEVIDSVHTGHSAVKESFEEKLND